MNTANISRLQRQHSNNYRSFQSSALNTSLSDGFSGLQPHRVEPNAIHAANSCSTPANINLISNTGMATPISEIQTPDGGLTPFSNSGSHHLLPRIHNRVSDFDHSTRSLRENYYPNNASTDQYVRSVTFAPRPGAEAEAPISESPLPRPRSGSWTGAYESEEELEQHNDVAVFTGYEGWGSSSYQSIGSENRAPSTSAQSEMQEQNAHEQKLKRRLKFLFMNPIEKWKARRRFPWKLLLQIIKIFVVTSQLSMFVNQRYSHVAYLWDTRVSFSHMFLAGWESTREVTAYPPSDGPLAVYSKKQFFDYLDFAITSYTNLQDTAIGTYEYHHVNGTSTIMPSYLCCEHFNVGYSSRRNECVDFPWTAVNMSGKAWSTEKFLEHSNYTLEFPYLLSCSYGFKVMAVKLRTPPDTTVPDCYNLTSSIEFDNNDRDGQMLVALSLQATVLSCSTNSTAEETTPASTAINCITIMVCAMSLIMCLRSMYRAQHLRYVTSTFFRNKLGQPLDIGDQLEFCNLWYVLICINDVFIIVGTLLKLGLENRVLRVNHFEFVKGTTPPIASQNYEGYLDTWNVCSLFLGVGNLLVWFGCLRYLGFFKTYNMMILTVKKCLPNVLRYSCCAFIVFAGYSLCGWLILSPYHIKFRSLSSTMECLFSLVNGDDMYATFSSTSAKDPVIWYFSRGYLYTFISLFVYVILSIFLAIIMDSYDTIKKCYTQGFPLSPLKQFVQECQEDATSHVFHEDGDRTLHDIINSLFCCCLPPCTARKTQPSDSEREREPLLRSSAAVSTHDISNISAR